MQLNKLKNKAQERRAARITNLFAIPTGIIFILILSQGFTFPSVYSQAAGMNPNINTANSTGNFLTFEDPDGNYKISYPQGWTHEYKQLQLAEFFTPTESYDMNISKGMPGIPTLQISSGDPTGLPGGEGSLNETVEGFKGGRNIEDEEQIELKGNPAHKLVFNDQGFRNMAIFTRTSTPLDFSFYYSAAPELYEKYLPIIQTMIESVDLK